MKTSTVLAGLLVAGASFAFACGGMNGGMKQGCDGKGAGDKMQKGCDSQKPKGCDSKMQNGHSGCDKKFMKNFMDSVDTLGLTKEQEAKIKKIIDENPPKMANALEAFNGDKFDTQKYIDTMQNQKIERIKHQADLIAKIYAVLTPEQKTEVKNDLKNSAMPMKGKCDKSAACGR